MFDRALLGVILGATRATPRNRYWRFGFVAIRREKVDVDTRQQLV
jgi:hypothetical protein